MEPGALVVLSCCGPREKLWGVLVALTPAGVTVRGVHLEAFEEWLRQHARGDVPSIGSATVFFPAHRVERIELDESWQAVEGLGDRFRRLTRRDPREAVLAADSAGAGAPVEQ